MVFTEILRRLVCRLWIVAVILLASCAEYRTLRVEVLKPARITIEPGKTVGYWDRNIRPQTDTSFVLNRYPGLSADELAYTFYSGLQSVFREAREGDSLQPMSGRERVYLADRQLPEPVRAADLKKLKEAFGMDYIIALEKIGYYPDPDRRKISCNLFLRLYSCDRGTVMDSVGYANDLTEGIVNEYELGDYIHDQLWNCGIECAYRMKPHWVSMERRIYNGEKVLKMGDVFLLREDQEQARKLWNAATSMSPKQAVRAYINLAWLYESRGNFEEAGRMLRRGLELAESKNMENTDVGYLKEYLKIITQRIKDAGLLDRQL